MKTFFFLHALIHSLSESQKASFSKSLQSGKKGVNSLYLKLFLAIDGQQTYDEAALRVQFEGTSFGKSLGFPKSHLYDRLLDHLHALQFDSASAPNLRRELDKVELLAEMGLPEQALRLIEKGLKLAAELEDAVHALQFLRLKRRQVMRLQVHQLSAEMAKISEEEVHWERVYQLEQVATRLHDHLYAMTQEVRRVSNVSEDPIFQAFWQSSEELLGQPDLGFHGRIAVLRARSHFYHLQEDFVAVHGAFQAEIQVWEAHPQQIAHAPLRYCV